MYQHRNYINTSSICGVLPALSTPFTSPKQRSLVRARSSKPEVDCTYTRGSSPLSQHSAPPRDIANDGARRAGLLRGLLHWRRGESWEGCSNRGTVRSLLPAPLFQQNPKARNYLDIVLPCEYARLTVQTPILFDLVSYCDVRVQSNPFILKGDKRVLVERAW
jgi:hypothetical protein